MNLTFIENLVFSTRWHKRSDAEGLRVLQNILLTDPDAGDSIKGCGMLRKVRFGDESRGKGKRGGVRVIYMHTPEAMQIDLLTVYSKDDAEDLSASQIQILCELARILRHQARERVRREREIEAQRKR